MLLVPRLGTATFVALLVAGQMLASLILDHYGLLGVPQH
jgi:bacterial/archaeal transporter family-2 protein